MYKITKSKKQIFAIILLITGLISYNVQTTHAQQQTLIGGDSKISGYGALDIKGGMLAGENTVFIGGKGALLINNTIAIGLGGYGSVNRNLAPYSSTMTFPQTSSSNLYLDMGYGGLILEYINNSDDLLHFNANVLFGAGGASHSETKFMSNNWDYLEDFTHPSTLFWVVEPSANLELNVTSFMKIGAGVSYRVVTGVDWDNLNTINKPELLPTSKNLSGLTGQITFKFGGF